MKKTANVSNKPHPDWPKSYLYVAKPYGYEVHCFRDKKTFLKAVSLCDYYPEAGDLQATDGIFYRGRVKDTGRVVWCLAIFDGMLSTLVHEVGHLCFAVFDTIQADAADCNNEPYCYLLGDAFDSIAKGLKL